MNSLGFAFMFSFVSFVGVIVEGWAIAKLWNWFVVGLLSGISQLNIAHATGLVFMLSVFRIATGAHSIRSEWDASRKERIDKLVKTFMPSVQDIDPTDAYLKKLANAIGLFWITPPVFVGMGYIVKLCL